MHKRSHRTARADAISFELKLPAAVPACTGVFLPGWLWFGTHWFGGITLLVLLTVISAAFGYVQTAGVRITAAIILALAVVIMAYVPFIRLLYVLISTSDSASKNVCGRLPPGYLVYLLAALQLAHAHVFWVLFLTDEDGAFYNVCGNAVLPGACTHDVSFLVMARLFYYSAVTFVSVGYGDIGPRSLVASMFVLPELWAPIFFLGILLGRIIRGSETDGPTAVQ